VDRLADIRALWMQRTVAYRLLHHHLKTAAPVGALRVHTHLRSYVGLCRESAAISLQHLAERLGKRQRGVEALIRGWRTVLLLLLHRRLRPCERWVHLGLLRHSLLGWSTVLAPACMTAPLGIAAFVVMLQPSLRRRMLLRPARMRTVSCCCCSSSSSSSSPSSAPPSCPQPFGCQSLSERHVKERVCPEGPLLREHGAGAVSARKAGTRSRTRQ